MTSSTSEQDIAKWLLENKEHIRDEFSKRVLPNTIFPPDIYKDIVEQQLLDYIKDLIEEQFYLNPEELALTLQAEWVKLILDAKS